ncbi:centromere protein H [Apus apus]|uniref:centromere protein H n=1 Tax=Apus apus TaxID=8895 RepID=UPI0021F8E7EA|nr:centromere protein H [Apus apus]
MEPLPLQEKGEGVSKVDVDLLLRLRDQMKQQFKECSAAVGATSQETDLFHITEEGSATQGLARFWQDFPSQKILGKDVEAKRISFQNKTLALQRIQVALALKNKLKENDNDSRLIMKMMEDTVRLSKAVAECQQQVREKEQKLNDIKRKRLSLKKVEGKKLQQIRTMMEEQKEKQANMKVSKKLEEKRKRLQKEIQLTTVIQNIFQSIIFGSGVNWAEDPSLKEVVLKLEKNVCFL